MALRRMNPSLFLITAQAPTDQAPWDSSYGEILLMMTFATAVSRSAAVTYPPKAKRFDGPQLIQSRGQCQPLRRPRSH